MFTISLHGIEVYALLGVFPEEEKMPNRFEVDADLKAAPHAPFIDYGIIQEHVHTEMHSGDYQTLEAACKGILHRLQKAFPQAVSGSVVIRKYTLPFGRPVRYAQVRLEQDFLEELTV